MSALALQYPSKPSVVADDLEVLIYVILYMAVRFHQHDMSPLLEDDASLDEQLTANAENDSLARFMSNFFYEDEITATGHFTGGKTKMNHIKHVNVPIELNGSELLSRFFTEAYCLLQRHYKKIDFDLLQPYAIGRERPQVAPKATDFDEQPDHMHNYFADVGLAPIAKPTRIARSPMPKSISASSAQSGDSASKALEDHDEMMSLFYSISNDVKGRCLNTQPYKGDKWFDQIAKIKHHVPKAAKGDLSRSKRTFSGGSRGDSSAASEVGPPRIRRRLETRSYALNVDPVGNRKLAGKKKPATYRHPANTRNTRSKAVIEHEATPLGTIIEEDESEHEEGD